jgi:TatD DNase family protein
LIDTHCHLTDTRLASQLPEVMARAAAAGVSNMVTVGTQPGDWEAALQVAERHPNVRCAIGVHPNHSHDVEIEQLLQLRGLQAHPAVVALGEMGLDYHYNHSPRDRQQQFLEIQLAMAVELNRPVIIHSRESTEDCLRVMKNYPVSAAVFHCFTGTVAEAEKILSAGYLLGFTGVVTYKNAPQLREIVRSIPADRLLVETDSPYLSPEPVRSQKTCEPAFVMHTARAVAAARGGSIEVIDQITTANAKTFYRWK